MKEKVCNPQEEKYSSFDLIKLMGCRIQPKAFDRLKTIACTCGDRSSDFIPSETRLCSRSRLNVFKQWCEIDKEVFRLYGPALVWRFGVYSGFKTDDVKDVFSDEVTSMHRLKRWSREVRFYPVPPLHVTFQTQVRALF